MKNSSKQIDRKILKTLEPLNRLNPILLDELAAKSIVEEVPAGRIISRHGEMDSRQIYLLSGQVEAAIKGETKTNLIKTKTALKTPIAADSPRTSTLKTKTAATLLYIDKDLLELLMSDEPELNATYEVTEISADDNDDWMLTFLQSPAFLQLPTENIQKLLTRMEEIPAKKGQVVINQGAKDDNYFIIKSGSCNVHRKPYEGAADVLLATLPTGSGFGEEALISNSSRNATITMRENGSLMRLKKNDFLTLLINPLIPYFEHSETLEKLDEGCVVIDVRSEEESKQKPLDGSVNIPLSMLRLKFDSLNTEREYLLVCNDSSQSAAAAFLMIQNGFKCSVLKGGMNNGEIITTKSNPVAEISTPAENKEKAQIAAADEQTKKIAAQQEEIKAARKKAEDDIIKHKKELSESRARIAAKNKNRTSAATQTAKLKEHAAEEEKKAMQQRAEEVMKQSAAEAEQTRKKAEEEAALIKQRALEEAELLRAEKAEQELQKAQAESKALELQQKESNAAMKRAEEMMKQSAAAVEAARKQAEEEAALIKQRAIEEAEQLRKEVESARQKMEQDAARIKQEEEVIKKSALKMRNEADEIRKEAMNDAQQIRSEIEATRELLEKKLLQTQEDEQRKHDAIIAAAKEQADKLKAEKTQQAAAEAEAVRQKAKEDAARLHKELEETRKQIEAEAARVINDLQEQSKKASIENEVKEIGEEVVVERIAEPVKVQEDIDYKSVSIPGMSEIAPLDDEVAKQKAEAIKAKLSQSQENVIAKSNKPADTTKVHKKDNRTILEAEDDLFIFQEPATAAKAVTETVKEPAVSHRTKAEAELTQISVEPTQSKSVVIYPKQEQESAYRNNPFLNNNEAETTSVSNYANTSSASAANSSKTQSTQSFDKQAYMQKRQGSKSNTLAIAASFLMILAGAVFTLHATNTLKVQSIAALFNSGNDTVQPTAVAKTKSIRKKVLRADTKVNVKKKVSNKMDDIMQGWQDVLSEAENPKKSKK